MARKNAALARERIVSLKSARLAFDDPKLFWISGALALILQAAITFILWRVDSPLEILRHQLSLSPAEFLVQRDNWGVEKCGFFLQHYWLDFLYPPVYAVFFRCLLTQIQLSYPTNYVFHAMAFPIAAAIYDEIENICQLPLMANWTESSFVFYAGAFGAYGKWLLLLAMFFVAIHALGKMYWERNFEP